MATKQIDKELQSVYEQLNNDVIMLSWKWQIARRLFETEEKVEVLTKTAPSFFRACQLTFSDDVFLALSRLTDNSRSGGQDNLVIRRLVELLDQTSHPKLYGDLKQLADTAIDQCGPIRQHRHKRLAHSDLQVKLKYSTQPLPGVTYGDVDRAVTMLQEIINAFGRYFFDSETHFKIVEKGGVHALLTYLKKGIEAFEQEKRQVLAIQGNTGQIT